jgi:adenosine 3'-phospho 5'-phosphosulfate transporter B3
MLPSKRQDIDSPPVTLLGLDITDWPRTAQFCALSAAVFVFYLGYGYMQELIFKLDGIKPFGWYLTLFQFIVYSTLSYSEMKITTGVIRRIPWNTYAQIAFYTVATMGLSNASLGYLNYPTQVIFKCCKLIPVLIGGILIQGKRYTLLDAAAAALMSLGLIWFSLADSQVSPNFDPRGYVMISLALVADAIIGNVQEKAMKMHGASNSEVVLYSYSLGSLYIFVGVVFTGEFFEAFKFFLENPLKTYGYTLIFGVLGYIGVNVVLTLVRTTGALVAVTVTTMRKAVTIIFSFILFSKPFTVNYVWAGLLVLFALYLNVYSKNRDRFNSKLAAWWSNRSRSTYGSGKLVMGV